MADRRTVYIKNDDDLYLGDQLVFVISKTPVHMIKSYFNEVDLKATYQEKLAMIAQLWHHYNHTVFPALEGAFL